MDYGSIRIAVKNGGNTIISDVCDLVKVRTNQVPTVSVYIQCPARLSADYSFCDSPAKPANGKLGGIWLWPGIRVPESKHVSLGRASAPTPTRGISSCFFSKSLVRVL
jgi:hypothetical protein